MFNAATQIISKTIMERSYLCTALNAFPVELNTSEGTKPSGSSSLFPGISPGYLGWSPVCESMTLNAAFFADLRLDRVLSCEEIIVYPQRIPREGFFDEVLSNETTEAETAWINKRSKLMDLSSEVMRTGWATNPVRSLNLLGLILRYGLGSRIKISLPDTPRAGNDMDYRLALIKYDCLVTIAKSQDTPIPLSVIEKLTRSALFDDGVRPEIRAQIFCRYLVTVARYLPANQKGNGLLEEAVAALKAHLESASPKTFSAQISHSVLWRGLCMWTGFNPIEKEIHLNEAERLANSAVPETRVEAILKAENQVTLLQTLAKWRGQKDPQIRENLYRRIIAVDPVDSTAYSELGLSLFQREEWAQAHDVFSKAALLGPPALGLNYFFQRGV